MKAHSEKHLAKTEWMAIQLVTDAIPALVDRIPAPRARYRPVHVHEGGNLLEVPVHGEKETDLMLVVRELDTSHAYGLADILDAVSRTNLQKIILAPEREVPQP